MKERITKIKQTISAKWQSIKPILSDLIEIAVIGLIMYLSCSFAYWSLDASLWSFTARIVFLLPVLSYSFIAYWYSGDEQQPKQRILTQPDEIQMSDAQKNRIYSVIGLVLALVYLTVLIVMQ